MFAEGNDPEGQGNLGDMRLSDKILKNKNLSLSR